MERTIHVREREREKERERERERETGEIQRAVSTACRTSSIFRQATVHVAHGTGRFVKTKPQSNGVGRVGRAFAAVPRLTDHFSSRQAPASRKEASRVRYFLTKKSGLTYRVGRPAAGTPFSAQQPLCLNYTVTNNNNEGSTNPASRGARVISKSAWERTSSTLLPPFRSL